MSEKGWDSAHVDELEAYPVDEEGLVWRPVRRRFGIEAFGVNAYTAADEGDRVVEEHSEQDGHEELYLVVRGHATFTLEDEELDAPAGTFVFVRPGTRRGAIAREAGTTVVGMGAKRGEVFRPSGWEWSFIASSLARRGEHERAVEIMREGVALYPESSQGSFNLACFLTLAGDRDGALAELRRAIELDEEARGWARHDSDFDALRDDPEFQSLVAGEADARSAGA